MKAIQMYRPAPLILAACALLSACTGIETTQGRSAETTQGRSADDKNMPPELVAALRSGACPYVTVSRSERRSSISLFSVRVWHKVKRTQSYSCPSAVKGRVTHS